MDSDTKEDDFTNISVIGTESNTLFSATYKKTKESVCLFKSPQLSIEHALEFISIYSEIKCDHILPIYKYYFRPNVTFITKFPIKGKPLPDILTKISEKDKLTILLQIIDTVRIFQSYNYFSTFFDINSIYVDEQNDFHVQFLSIFPIYITQHSFSNFKMNAALIFNIMKVILGKEKASFYFDKSNFYQSAFKLLYYLIQQISKNNSTLNVNIIKYENYFKKLIELANETNSTEIYNKNSDKSTNEQQEMNENAKNNEISNEQAKSNENINDYENQILESQYLCVISGINEKKYLLNLANKNYPKGQFLYGYRMINGIGIRKDPIRGAKYVKNAADSSYPEAQLYYSLLLKEGKGIRQNLNQSMNYLKIASDNKSKESLVLYGNSISNTMPAIAVLCYKEAASRGSIEGFFYYFFSVNKSSHLKKGNKSNTCSSIINFNITFCSNITVFKNSYKNFLNTMPLGYLKLMIDDEFEESYAQFLYGFFYTQIQSLFLNSLSIKQFDVNDIYDSNIDNNDEKGEIFLEKSMKSGNLYSMYVYSKILFNRGQIQTVYEYLKDNKDCWYKNIEYYYAKCLQNMIIPHKYKKKLKINEMISEAAKNECYEAIYEEGENLYETDSNSSWANFYQAAKSGISLACLKYGKYIIKSNVNKGKYFLKLCANEIPEAEYILSTYSDNPIVQMNHLKKAADKGFSKAAYLFGFNKYKDGDFDTAMKYFKKSSDPLSFLYLAHCSFLKKKDCSLYIKLAADSNISQAHLPYGICLYHGIGMNKNQIEAEKNFRHSLSFSDFIGIYNLAVCMAKKMNQNEIYSFLINQKNNAEKNKNKDDINDNDNKSFSIALFNSSSDFGLSYIYLYLGYLVYLKGDLKEAKRYFKNAASKGNMMAAILFAKCIEMTASSQSKLFTALKIYRLVIRHLSEPVFASNSYACQLKRKAQLSEELLKKRLNVISDIQHLKEIADQGDDMAQYFYAVYCFDVDGFYNKNPKNFDASNNLVSQKKVEFSDANKQSKVKCGGDFKIDNSIVYQSMNNRSPLVTSNASSFVKNSTNEHKLRFFTMHQKNDTETSSQRKIERQIHPFDFNANRSDEVSTSNNNENQNHSFSFNSNRATGTSTSNNESQSRSFSFSSSSNESQIHPFSFNSRQSVETNTGNSNESKAHSFSFSSNNNESKVSSFNFTANRSTETAASGNEGNSHSFSFDASRTAETAINNVSNEDKIHPFSFNTKQSVETNTSNNNESKMHSFSFSSDNNESKVSPFNFTANRSTETAASSNEGNSHSFSFSQSNTNSNENKSHLGCTDSSSSKANNDNDDNSAEFTRKKDEFIRSFNFSIKIDTHQKYEPKTISFASYGSKSSFSNSKQGFSKSQPSYFSTSSVSGSSNSKFKPFNFASYSSKTNSNKNVSAANSEIKICPFNFDIKKDESNSASCENKDDQATNKNKLTASADNNERKIRPFNYDIKSNNIYNFQFKNKNNTNGNNNNHNNDNNNNNDNNSNNDNNNNNNDNENDNNNNSNNNSNNDNNNNNDDDIININDNNNINNDNNNNDNENDNNNNSINNSNNNENNSYSNNNNDNNNNSNNNENENNSTLTNNNDNNCITQYKKTFKKSKNSFLHRVSSSPSPKTSTTSPPSKSEGIRYLEASVSSGNDKAEEFLARCLIEGNGIKTNISRAVSLFVSASKKGNGQAKNNLGLLYKRGIYVCKDDKAAFELFKESAESGNPSGLLHYAMCLMKGRGVELNISLAMPPLRKARELGVPRASYILGLHYLNSDQNGGTEGMKLIKEAANLGYKKAKLILEL